jgi:hypothetical protein
LDVETAENGAKVSDTLMEARDGVKAILTNLKNAGRGRMQEGAIALTFAWLSHPYRSVV